ncbi:MAG: alanine racemase, partial [Planctomycetota bacterium]
MSLFGSKQRAASLHRNCAGTPPLRGILEPWMTTVLGSPNPFRWVQQYGSPVNLVNPKPMLRNGDQLSLVAKSFGIDLQVYFARKANKCLAFVDVATQHGFGIDTASENEIRQSLRQEVPAGRMICTAAIKTDSLLRLCIEKQIVLAVDNHDELHAIVALATQMQIPALIALRLGGFQFDGARLPTRFGFDIETIHPLIADLRTMPVSLRGLHFHLDGYDAQQRIAALLQTLEIYHDAAAEHADLHFIDIGGGVPMCYLKDEHQWTQFWHVLRQSLTGQHPPITRNQSGFGLREHHGEILGRTNLYPFWQSVERRQWLRSILNFDLNESADRDNAAPDGNPSGAAEIGHSIGQHLADHKIQLRCEPGRSLLDGCGMTMAAVEFCKYQRDGDLLVGLAMNSTQCRTTHDDFLVDPIVLHAPDATRRDTSGRHGYLVGAY